VVVAVTDDRRFDGGDASRIEALMRRDTDASDCGHWQRVGAECAKCEVERLREELAEVKAKRNALHDESTRLRAAVKTYQEER
jgi:hypothetical protein